MTNMFEVTFISHALCDYLRPLVGADEIRVMDLDNNAGEWLCAITWGLAMCEEKQIPLPLLFAEKILSLEDVNEAERSGIRNQFAHIPTLLEMAS